MLSRYCLTFSSRVRRERYEAFASFQTTCNDSLNAPSSTKASSTDAAYWTTRLINDVSDKRRRYCMCGPLCDNTDAVIMACTLAVETLLPIDIECYQKVANQA